MAKMMHAIRLHDYGGPQELKFEETPRPEPGAGQVLVRVAAAGVNPADWKIGKGLFKQFSPVQFPWTPGLEASGVVEALGADVSQFWQGQEVYGVVRSGYAEYALTKAADLQPKPANLSFEQAAAVPIGALNAWGAVINAANVQPGQRVLVHGAAGGIGSYAVQLARWIGAAVIGTASAGNVDFVRSLGAEKVIDYSATAFESQVHDLDVVIDTVGGDLAERSFKVLRPGGIYATVAGRPAEDAGKAQGVRAMSAGAAPAETLKEISGMLESGILQPVLGKTFPLSQAAQAQALSETRHGRGRIVLIVQT